MFEIEKFKNLTVKWPVKFEAETADGETATGEYTAHFKILPDDEVQKLAVEGDAALISEVLVGWNGIGDKDGELSFTKERLDQLMQMSFWRVQTISAYYEALAVCARKN